MTRFGGSSAVLLGRGELALQFYNAQLEILQGCIAFGHSALVGQEHLVLGVSRLLIFVLLLLPLLLSFSLAAGLLLAA